MIVSTTIPLLFDLGRMMRFNSTFRLANSILRLSAAQTLLIFVAGCCAVQAGAISENSPCSDFRGTVERYYGQFPTADGLVDLAAVKGCVRVADTGSDDRDASALISVKWASVMAQLAGNGYLLPGFDYGVVRQVLLVGATSNDADVSVEAILALSWVGGVDAASAITRAIRLLKSERVRRAGLSSLAQFCGDEGLDALQELVGVAEVSEHATMAISEREAASYLEQMCRVRISVPHGVLKD